jgi:hypothetical protein
MARRLAANVWVGDQFFEAGSVPPKEIAEQITNPKAWGDTVAEEPEAPKDPGSSETPEATESAYAGWKAAELKAEIATRNEGRDDDAKLPAKGKNADLIAALEADDAA